MEIEPPPAAKPRHYLLCCVRLSPEKEPERFVDLVEELVSRGALAAHGLTPYLIGPAKTPYAEVRSMLPDFQGQFIHHLVCNRGHSAPSLLRFAGAQGQAESSRARQHHQRIVCGTERSCGDCRSH